MIWYVNRILKIHWHRSICLWGTNLWWLIHSPDIEFGNRFGIGGWGLAKVLIFQKTEDMRLSIYHHTRTFFLILRQFRISTSSSLLRKVGSSAGIWSPTEWHPVCFVCCSLAIFWSCDSISNLHLFILFKFLGSSYLHQGLEGEVVRKVRRRRRRGRGTSSFFFPTSLSHPSCFPLFFLVIPSSCNIRPCYYVLCVLTTPYPWFLVYTTKTHCFILAGTSQNSCNW